MTSLFLGVAVIEDAEREREIEGGKKSQRRKLSKKTFLHSVKLSKLAIDREDDVIALASNLRHQDS